jgi:carboxymethylenebutenolidase
MKFARVRSLAIPALVLAIGVLLNGVTTTAFSQSVASPTPITPLTVTFPSGDETVSALVYLPATKGPHPAIVVVPEWWGVTDWVKDQATDLATHGYISLIVDLYRGKSTSDPGVAHELWRGLPQDRALRDMQGAVTYLQSRKDVRKDRIGAIGWCMGGGYALQLALSNPAIRAVAVNYGSLPTDKSQIIAMKADMLGNFGAQDRGITPTDIHSFEATLVAAGRYPDIKIYPDVGHAFQNPDNKTGYSAADTQDAHQRILAFFKRTLDS